MATALIQTAFVTGEVSPSLFGHVDLARMHSAAATFRNGYVGYRGGYYSRAGTKFVGFSKQTGRALPPRMITFQFSINQGLALEFGNFYMRVVSNGEFVIEPALDISNITKANPGVVTYASGIVSATPNSLGVTASYAPTNTVTLAGGTFSVPAVVTVTNTKLVSVALNAAGVGNYAGGDVITLAGGTHSVAAKVIVNTSKVVSATIVSGGAGGAPGVYTAVGTTGTGNPVQLTVTVAAGAVSLISAISVPGSYSTNPTDPTLEPVAIPGSGVTGAVFNIVLGIETFAISERGVYTVNPGGAAFTQASSTGTGTGATFNTAVMGPNAVTVTTPGTYTVFPASPASQSATSGSGVGATFDLVGSATYANGDWAFLSGIGGMIELNGETVVVANATASTFELRDVYGNPIDTSAFAAYTSGGTAARIYTLPTIYSENDLDYLKFTQSADVMSLTCVNQQTLTEYPPQDLSRHSDNNWSFSGVVASPSVGPPASAPTMATSTAGTIRYSYVVTSVSPTDGTESIASDVGTIINAVNIAATAGTITVTWPAVAGVNVYNVYKATPGDAVTPPVGALYGYAGTALGTQLLDSNIVADFAQVPPTHQDPFARGQIIAAQANTGGAGYTAITLAVVTATGTGAHLEGVLVGGALSAILIVDAGKGYLPGDTVSVSGDGAGATASVTVGALTGTYPGVVAYFQQRRFYGYTINNPDTYFGSQPGAYTNFDSRVPTVPNDAIIGTPWAVQVDGIQFLTPMPGGLVAHTGAGAWLVSGGAGGALNPQPIEPASQSAQPQGYNGCSSTVPPVKINDDIVFVQAKGSIYRAISYQIQGNIYSSADITINSPQLFNGFTIRQHAWCEEPYKVLWAVRNDGVLLSATYLKAQEVLGWARSDTNGLFMSVCSVTEPPVDALYAVVQRFPSPGAAFMIERMDNRIWPNVEATWCVDCGLSLPQPVPAAALTVVPPTGLGAITGVTGLVGGSSYSASTTASVVDDNGQGPGTGAVPTLTIAGGVITAISFAGHEGSGYVNPRIDFVDPTNEGSGAAARLTLDNSATFEATAAVFGPGNVGDVIRMGGGVAVVTGYVSTTEVVGQVLSPIVATIPNSGGLVIPQNSGKWTMTTPVSTISGLKHLAGLTVTGLADGNVIPPAQVPLDGIITLGAPASAVTIGLAFLPQLQSIYLDAGSPTVQGQRKKIAAVTTRVELSRGMEIGTNQTDGSTLSPPEIAPDWSGLTELPITGPNLQMKPYNATATPLLTGDIRLAAPGGFSTKGQIAIQQPQPLPMCVLAFIPEFYPGDLPQTKQPRRATGNQQNSMVDA